MKIGDKGAGVADWQEFLNKAGYRDGAGKALNVDGNFGPKTEFATKAFQKDAGIPVTGEVSALMLANAGKAIPVAPASDPTVRFVPAKNFTRANRTAVDLVVIHTMEAPEKPKTALAVAQWAAGPNAPKASWHYGVDDSSIVQSVHEEDVAWHAPGANARGIGIEHTGYAKQTKEDWADPYSVSMLRVSASLVAKICRRWGIPPVKLSPADLKSGKRGICGHYDVTQAFNGGRGHWDPGPNFPWESYIASVNGFFAKLAAS